VNRYTYRAEWSPEYDEYIGLCIELPSLSRRAPTGHEAIAAIEEAVDQFVDDMQACGETAPTPLTERNYSGTFVVRTSPALHVRLVVEAAEGNVCL
jgi:predicted HicB family RNase H-like nuclease